MRPLQLLNVLAMLFSLSAAGYTQDKYICDRYQVFGPTNSKGTSIPYAEALNDADLVVGQLVQASEYGYFSRAGVSFQTYLVPGSASTRMYGVNNARKIVGSYYDDSVGSWQGFETSPGGSATTIDYPGAGQTFASGINNRDQIVGEYVPQNAPLTGFLLSDGQFTTVTVAGASETLPAAINDFGSVVGWWDAPGAAYPFIYNDGNYTLPIAPPTAQETFFTGINNQGEIAGYYLETGDLVVYKGFVYINGVYNSISIPGAKWVQLGGINNNGDIAGTIKTSAGEQPAFLGTSCHFQD